MYSLFETHKVLTVRIGYAIGVIVVIVGIMLLAVHFAGEKETPQTNETNIPSMEEKAAIKSKFDMRAGDTASQQERGSVYTRIRSEQESGITTPSQEQKDAIINAFTK